MGPGLQDPGHWNPGIWDPGSPSKFKSGTPGPLSKFKKEADIMVFPPSFTIMFYMKTWETFLTKQFSMNNFPRISSCLYGPLNKVMCFKLISPRFFRKDFITEDLLYIHEKPFEKVWKGQTKPEKAAFVLLDFVSEQWYSNWKYTCKCLVDLQIWNALLYL